MRKLILALICALLLPTSAARAQLAAPNAAGVSMGHLHYVVRDVAKNRAFWIAMGALPLTMGTQEAMRFPGLLVLLSQGEPSGASEGSVVDHVSFLVPSMRDLTAKMAEAGYKVQLTGGVGFVWTPEGEKIELLQDQAVNAKFTPDQGPYVAPPKMTVPIVLHHIHFYVPEGAVADAKAWYVKFFGALPGKRHKSQDPPYEAADLPGVNLNFAEAHDAPKPTKGRTLDHIGFEIQNLQAFGKKLEAAGLKLDPPYQTSPGGVASAALTDPWGTSIELTEGLDKR